MSLHQRDLTQDYAIRIEPLQGVVRAWLGDRLVAETTNAQVMYETRLPPAVYFPREDILADLSEPTELKTFCPFKGTARYRDLTSDGGAITNAVWSYDNPLPESMEIAGYVGFAQGTAARLDLGENQLKPPTEGSISAPLVDWLLRTAPFIESPEAFTTALADQLLANGISVSRISVMIWSLHPSIAGRHFIWNKGQDELTTMLPSYEIFDHPAFVNSPLYHVSQGRGGVRQKIGVDYEDNSFPIIEDLRKEGGTDYVAMPLFFSDGTVNVLTMTCDHPDGFTTGNLGLVFECSFMISRIFEVFALRDTARGVLETYVGKRTGARVLGGEIRRGDGDEIDAAIMFCDLRDSSRLVEELGQADYIEMLNAFFDSVTDCVHAHGGEVLKFIGDAVLAVFPNEGDASKARLEALTSAREIVARLAELRSEGYKADCSIGISYGCVTYGNIGSRERLDFTVIGHAANVAARLGDFGKKAGYRIIASSDFTTPECPGTPLGAVELHNVREAVSCFGISD
ncbi:DUF427 domain-containing protein [uncultured Shimia sp.]|uniref:DUF427 domain-containing protein n=1 Tax=uncultured Shimia sp. TaxID=573152 RepID=UPI00261103D2|nr:DUF427 domain-containing protein [uncultured Shimia sp.]